MVFYIIFAFDSSHLHTLTTNSERIQQRGIARFEKSALHL